MDDDFEKKVEAALAGDDKVGGIAPYEVYTILNKAFFDGRLDGNHLPHLSREIAKASRQVPASLPAPVAAPETEHGWVAYNAGPSEWFWSETRDALLHELSDEPRPATHLEKYFLNRQGNRTYENDIPAELEAMVDLGAKAMAHERYPEARWPENEQDSYAGAKDGKSSLSWDYVKRCQNAARAVLVAANPRANKNDADPFNALSYERGVLARPQAYTYGAVMRAGETLFKALGITRKKLSETQQDLLSAHRIIDKYEVDGQPRKKPKGEPEAFMTIHMNGEDRLIVDAAKYDPRKTDYWISPEVQWAHVVTPLYPAED